jgi:sterol desaturase/sphingolipid hydroxylase (fatty acid hydroxylase superfamily)
MSYDWMAALVFLGTLIAITVVGKFFAFKVPALQEMRELNAEADHRKMSHKRFRSAVKVNNKSAMITNLVFLGAILPFCLNLGPRPIWRHMVDIVVVLMVYDFFYYATHRFLFHGKPLRKIHALHHQARQPTYIDALYVHPIETAIGLILFLGTIPLIAVLTGGPLNAVSMAVATVIFTQVNSINHTYVNLPYFPFKTLDHITSIHAAHHVDMNCGNYATLTMLYDWSFGTLEKPVSRPAP